MDLKHIDAKLNKIDDRLNKIDVHLATYNEQLKYSMGRINKLEDDLAPVTKHVEQMRGIGGFISVSALVATVVGGIMAVISWIK